MTGESRTRSSACPECNARQWATLIKLARSFGKAVFSGTAELIPDSPRSARNRLETADKRATSSIEASSDTDELLATRCQERGMRFGAVLFGPVQQVNIAREASQGCEPRIARNSGGAEKSAIDCGGDS